MNSAIHKLPPCSRQTMTQPVASSMTWWNKKDQKQLTCNLLDMWLHMPGSVLHLLVPGHYQSCQLFFQTSPNQTSSIYVLHLPASTTCQAQLLHCLVPPLTKTSWWGCVDSPSNPELWPSQNLVPDLTYPHDLLHRLCRMPMWSTHWPPSMPSSYLLHRPCLSQDDLTNGPLGGSRLYSWGPVILSKVMSAKVSPQWPQNNLTNSPLSKSHIN